MQSGSCVGPQINNLVHRDSPGQEIPTRSLTRGRGNENSSRPEAIYSCWAYELGHFILATLNVGTGSLKLEIAFHYHARRALSPSRIVIQSLSLSFHST